MSMEDTPSYRLSRETRTLRRRSGSVSGVRRRVVLSVVILATLLATLVLNQDPIRAASFTVTNTNAAVRAPSGRPSWTPTPWAERIRSTSTSPPPTRAT